MVPAYDFATFPYASMAVTVLSVGTPAVTPGGGAATSNLVRAAGVTTTPLCLPEIEAFAMSVAVTDCVAAVRRTRPVKVKTPAWDDVKAWSAGRVACLSVVEIRTVPV